MERRRITAVILMFVALPALAQTVLLRGTVVTESGEPVKGASIQACTFKMGYGSICENARTDGGGKFSVKVARPQEAPPSAAAGANEPVVAMGEFTVTAGGQRAATVQARKKGFNWTEVEFSDWDNPAPDLRLVLGRGGNLSVLVDGVEQAQWGQLQVTVTTGGKELRPPAPPLPHKTLNFDAWRQAGGGSIDDYLARMPASANFTIRDVPVGEARIEVKGPSGEMLPAQTAKIAVGEQTQLRFRVPKSGLWVSGRVTVNGKPLSEVVVNFSRPGATTGTGVTAAADGSFRIEGLEPGEYTVRVMKKRTAVVGGASVVAFDEVGFVTWTLTESGTRDLELTELQPPRTP